MWRRMYIYTATMENSMEIPQKTKYRTTKKKKKKKKEKLLNDTSVPLICHMSEQNFH